MDEHIYDARKGVLGDYWMAQVDGILRCTHMHTTRKAAIKCAKRWQAFQDKVARMKQYGTLQKIPTKNA